VYAHGATCEHAAKSRWDWTSADKAWHLISSLLQVEEKLQLFGSDGANSEEHFELLFSIFISPW
jgi:hypothetical protein